MKAISIFNDVLGPVMRGPSSSHTAAPYQIGRMARSLLLGPSASNPRVRGDRAPVGDDGPAEAQFVFDPGGSFAQVYREQGSDLGFAAGLLGWSLTDERFGQVLDVAAREGVDIRFSVAPLAHLPAAQPEGAKPEPLPAGALPTGAGALPTGAGALPTGAGALPTGAGALHPNTVEMSLRSRQGRTLHAVARSTGGGALVFTEVGGWPPSAIGGWPPSAIGGWPVWLTGDAHELLVELEPAAVEPVMALLAPLACEVQTREAPAPVEGARGGRSLIHARCATPPAAQDVATLEALPGVSAVWAAEAIFYPQRGALLFASAAEMLAYVEREGCSLGEAGLAYEATLLGLSPAEVQAEALRRFEVMRAAVHRGLAPGPEGLPPMQLLQPTAQGIFQAERAGRLPTGGLHTRAAARAMAVMHVNGGMGVVCAAPTAGSAGTIPGVLVTLAEEPRREEVAALEKVAPSGSGPGQGPRSGGPGREAGLDERDIALALLAASAVGLVVAQRATFAAEVAGCQVEIGAAGAMAAAAVVEAAGGSARQALDAAAIAFQNTMGMVCDLVQGIVEIPCHTRNAAAAANAFLCADLILGGYHNPVPLDETVDAVMAVGQMLPRELKVTALGGLALAPSAQALPRLRNPRVRGDRAPVPPG